MKTMTIHSWRQFKCWRLALLFLIQLLCRLDYVVADITGETIHSGSLTYASEIIISPTGSLTIEAGSVVNISGQGSRIIVRGTLRIIGTEAKYVRFLGGVRDMPTAGTVPTGAPNLADYGFMGIEIQHIDGQPPPVVEIDYAIIDGFNVAIGQITRDPDGLIDFGHSRLVTVTNTIFSNNYVALHAYPTNFFEHSASSKNTDSFVNCEFRYNAFAMLGALYKEVKNSKFTHNGCGVCDGDHFTIENSEFVAHSRWGFEHVLMNQVFRTIMNNKDIRVLGMAIHVSRSFPDQIVRNTAIHGNVLGIHGLPGVMEANVICANEVGFSVVASGSTFETSGFSNYIAPNKEADLIAYSGNYTIPRGFLADNSTELLVQNKNGGSWRILDTITETLTPTVSPTGAPSPAPTRSPTKFTEAPTRSPTKFTGAPTSKPTSSDTPNRRLFNRNYFVEVEPQCFDLLTGATFNDVLMLQEREVAGQIWSTVGYVVLGIVSSVVAFFAVFMGFRRASHGGYQMAVAEGEGVVVVAQHDTVDAEKGMSRTRTAELPVASIADNENKKKSWLRFPWKSGNQDTSSETIIKESVKENPIVSTVSSNETSALPSNDRNRSTSENSDDSQPSVHSDYVEQVDSVPRPKYQVFEPRSDKDVLLHTSTGSARDGSFIAAREAASRQAGKDEVKPAGIFDEFGDGSEHLETSRLWRPVLVNPFLKAYYRNTKGNLQCFPGCLEFGDYAKAVLKGKQHKINKRTLCIGEVACDITVPSKGFNPKKDMLVLGRVATRGQPNLHFAPGMVCTRELLQSLCEEEYQLGVLSVEQPNTGDGNVNDIRVILLPTHRGTWNYSGKKPKTKTIDGDPWFCYETFVFCDQYYLSEAGSGLPLPRLRGSTGGNSAAEDMAIFMGSNGRLSASDSLMPFDLTGSRQRLSSGGGGAIAQQPGTHYMLVQTTESPAFDIHSTSKLKSKDDAGTTGAAGGKGSSKSSKKSRKSVTGKKHGRDLSDSEPGSPASVESSSRKSRKKQREGPQKSAPPSSSFAPNVGPGSLLRRSGRPKEGTHMSRREVPSI